MIASDNGELVNVKVHESAGTIVLNRPSKRNALSRETLAQLDAAFDDLHQTKTVRAVILTGSGSAFCAGMDLAEMQTTAQGDDAMMRWQEDTVQYLNLVQKMLRYPKPIIAAVNGPAVAGGLGLVLASDLVLGIEEARFGLPEPYRGLVAGIVAPLLAFRIGGGHAGRLLLTGQTIDCVEAMGIGLVDEYVNDDVLWARAVELANQIAKGAPEAIQLTKKLLNETIAETLYTQLSLGAAASATARTTAAAREGLAAFLEKREPDWDNLDDEA